MENGKPNEQDEMFQRWETQYDENWKPLWESELAKQLRADGVLKGPKVGRRNSSEKKPHETRTELDGEAGHGGREVGRAERLLQTLFFGVGRMHMQGRGGGFKAEARLQ